MGSKILGHWKRTMTPKNFEVEVGTYETASRATVNSIQTEANGLGRFFDRTATLNVHTI